mgnify:CR=1 FL=1
MKKAELRFTGSGGQGVIMATIILAEAAYADKLQAVQSQSYGPEARGGLCKAECIIDEKPIAYTKVVRPNLLLSLTQASLDKYVGTLQEHAIVVVDSGITVPEEVKAHHQGISLPILNSAVEVIKNPMAANIISVGAVNEIMKIASEASLEEAVINHIPKGTEEKNIKALHLGEKDLPLATLCGMSAVFAALFGTPLTATVFALEVISVGVLYYAGLIPCLMAASVAYLIASLFGVSPTRFAVTLPALDVWTVFLVVLLAIGCALVSILFVRGMHWVEHMAVRFLKNSYLRAAAGGFAIIGLTLLLGRDYNGAGMDVIARAVEQGEAAPWAWFLKILFTALTIGCGFKGGEVVPSFFVGATFGCVAGQALGLPGGFGAAIGLVAVFCGAVNCPIASVLLSLELFGGTDGVLYFAFACAISYLLSGYCGLYSSQTILYSKLRAEFINVHAKE